MKKIILVDDANYFLMSTKERLRKHYEVYPAQSADILFEILEKVTPDLILLDVHMPDCDGFETIKKIKNDSRYAKIPVIFLSALGKKQNMIKAMENGAVDFITKPYSTSTLVESIENQLSPVKQEANRAIILAIDDSVSILQSINHMLSKQYTVYTLPHPEIIVDALKKVTPDLFLLDYQMPKVTGFDLVPIIRKTKKHEETPIVFLTSEGTIDHVTVAISLGACDFIVKPIDEKTLLDKMSTHLASYLMRRRMRLLR